MVGISNMLGFTRMTHIDAYPTPDKARRYAKWVQSLVLGKNLQ